MDIAPTETDCLKARLQLPLSCRSHARQAAYGWLRTERRRQKSHAGNISCGNFRKMRKFVLLQPTNRAIKSKGSQFRKRLDV